MKFAVFIEETLQRKIIVEAENIKEAKRFVQTKLDNDEIVLNSDDYDGCRIISVVEEERKRNETIGTI